MARTNTTNLNLVQPDRLDQYNVDDFNSNMEKIDNFAGLVPPRALTADKLTVGRNINGVMFDGTQDIEIPPSGANKDLSNLTEAGNSKFIRKFGADIKHGDMTFQAQDKEDEIITIKSNLNRYSQVPSNQIKFYEHIFIQDANNLMVGEINASKDSFGSNSLNIGTTSPNSAISNYFTIWANDTAKGATLLGASIDGFITAKWFDYQNSGWVKFSDGFVIQWGVSGYVDDNQWGTINLHLPLTTTSYAISGYHNFTSIDGSKRDSWAIGSKRTNGFDWWCGLERGPGNVHGGQLWWKAVGF